MAKELTLRIIGSSPDRLSLSRLSAYLKLLAELYGGAEHIHFEQVRSSSAALVSVVDDNYLPKVTERLREAHAGVGSRSAIRAYQRINEMLGDDGSGGEVYLETARIIQFPVVNRSDNDLRLVQAGQVQGRLYNVGGKDDTVPVKIEGADGEALSCEASIDIAKQLASLLFTHVRVFGKGSWERRGDGTWKLRKFYISSFETVKDVSLSEAVGALRTLGKTRWDEMNDPHSAILEARH